MKSDIPNRRNLVKVDSKTADILKKKFIEFKEIFDTEKEQFTKSSQTTYYIVSTKYINEWTEFCQSNQSQRYQPNPMNQDLMDAGGQLRKGLLQSHDFEILNQKVYNLLKGDIGIQLYRQAVFVNEQKRVPIYLDKIIKYMKLTGESIKKMDVDSRSFDKVYQKQLMIKPIAVSSLQTGDSLLRRIIKIQGLERVKGRLWKNNKSTSVSDVYQYMKPLAKKCFRFPGIGKYIEDTSIPLENMNIQQGDYFIAQIVDNHLSNFYLKTEDEAKCQYCNRVQKLRVECPCKKVKYCNETCMEKDKRFHLKNCKYAQQQELNQQVKMTITQGSSLGKVGLTNLGNTCFMNSCLQCLSNTTPLTEYFLKSYYQKQVNKTNPLGSEGRLAKNYAKFIKNMWCQSQSTYSPYNLKGAVAKLNPIFSGYAQHDSQQFFSYLVDGIHEDLNRVVKKPYVESVDSKGRQDHIVALESWIAYTQRNQSIIVDLMTGQYKSKVICPTCNLQSITFDPFTTVSLPIPQEATSKILKYYVIYSNNHKQASRMSFQYTKADTKQWLNQAVSNIDRLPEDFMFYVLTVYENIYNFETTSKAEILHKVEVQNKNIFLLQLTPEQKNIKQRVQITAQLCKSTYKDKQFVNLWFKRPFFFQKNKTTVLSIYKRILQFLFTILVKKKQFKNYEEFEKKMLQERIFTLVLKSKKSLQRFYNRVEVKFDKQLLLNQDQLTLVQILKNFNLSDCELDIRFNKQNSKYFQFDKLKSFQDVANKNQKKNSHKQDYSTVTLDQCFSVFQQKQQLDHGNEWYCPRCKQHRLATKQMTIYKAPQILILHLKRFKNKGIIRKQKNQTNVIFPLVLNLSKYVIDPEPMSSYINELKKNEKYLQPSYKSERGSSQPQYQLYAISNHFGGLGGGHYTAYAKNNGKWYQFNDSSVRPASEEQIKGSGAYMLFYKRVNGLKIK